MRDVHGCQMTEYLHRWSRVCLGCGRECDPMDTGIVQFLDISSAKGARTEKVNPRC